MYDAHSIGFQYEKIVFCRKESEDEEQMRNWATYLPMAVNPEVAEEHGYFWTVKEIRLWEGSDVAFGANELTPMLGLKSANKTLLQDQLFAKLDICQKLTSKGKMSDDGFHQLDMEIKQIKSYISTLTEQQPSKKGTGSTSRTSENTSGKDFMKALFNG